MYTESGTRWRQIDYTDIGKQVLTALGWMTVGAAVMYILDPDRGNRRRSLARDKMVRAGHVAGRTMRGSAQYGRGKIKGMAAEAAARMQSEDVSDEQLRRRVRSEMGHVIDDASRVDVDVHDGIVTLSGSLPEDQADRLIHAISGVRSVREVENHLTVNA